MAYIAERKKKNTLGEHYEKGLHMEFKNQKLRFSTSLAKGTVIMRKVFLTVKAARFSQRSEDLSATFFKPSHFKVVVL